MDESETGVDTERARFDREFWEARWSEVLSAQPEHLRQRTPNSYLKSAVGDLVPGRALDAGCGNGSEALWLAAQGWRVTAVDFSAAAFANGKATANLLGSQISHRVSWVEADLGGWTPAAREFELVCSLYVHVSGAVEEMVNRLADGVASGGSLLLVGHLPADLATGAATRAAGQVQVSVETAVTVLSGPTWAVATAENRPRADGNGHDAVILARRLA